MIDPNIETPPATEATLEEMRQQAVNEIVAIFAGSGSDRVTRYAAEAAFMRGVWAGKLFNSGQILDLQERDREAVKALIAARRVSEPRR